jgi:hypothetical protein
MITRNTQHREAIMAASRELDRRKSNGIEVALLWNPHTDQVLVSVVDDRRVGTQVFEVAAQDALDAFHHPFIFAPPDLDGTTLLA